MAVEWEIVGSFSLDTTEAEADIQQLQDEVGEPAPPSGAGTGVAASTKKQEEGQKGLLDTFLGVDKAGKQMTTGMQGLTGQLFSQLGLFVGLAGVIGGIIAFSGPIQGALEDLSIMFEDIFILLGEALEPILIPLIELVTSILGLLIPIINVLKPFLAIIGIIVQALTFLVDAILLIPKMIFGFLGNIFGNLFGFGEDQDDEEPLAFQDTEGSLTGTTLSGIESESSRTDEIRRQKETDSDMITVLKGISEKTGIKFRDPFGIAGILGLTSLITNDKEESEKKRAETQQKADRLARATPREVKIVKEDEEEENKSFSNFLRMALLMDNPEKNKATGLDDFFVDFAKA